MSENNLSTPLVDSGMVLENSLEVAESDAEVDNTFDNTLRVKAKYKKSLPCFLSGKKINKIETAYASKTEDIHLWHLI